MDFLLNDTLLEAAERATGDRQEQLRHARECLGSGSHGLHVGGVMDINACSRQRAAFFPSHHDEHEPTCRWFNCSNLGCYNADEHVL